MPARAFSITALAAAGFLGAPGAALAVLPYGTLDFVQRADTVAADQQIDVWMRLTIDPASPALDFSSNPLMGFVAGDLPTEGNFWNPLTEQNEVRPFVEVTEAFLNTYFGCDDTFTGGCDGDTTNYSYSFFLADQPGKPSINFRHTFSLAPSASFEYVFAQFNPAVGGAQPDTYYFYSTGVLLQFRGLDADGNIGDSDAHTIASTCPLGNSADCAFTRTVVAVPEPDTYALMALGLLAVGAVVRRRAP